MQSISAIFSGLTVAGFLTFAGVTGYESTPSKEPDLVQPVGIIELFKPENVLAPFNKGTGVFISPTQVLTASHVMDDAGKDIVSKIRMENGDTYNIIDIKQSDDVDVAVLTVDRPYKGYVPAFSCETQKRGAELMTVGSPLVMEFIESKVMVTGGQPMTASIQDEGQTQDPEKSTEPNNRTRPEDLLKNQKPEKKKRFAVVPPDKVAPPKKEVKAANLKGAKFFQGIALPGQSGSPVYDKDGKIVGIIAISIIDGGSGSYAGVGMYIEMPAACQFLKDTVKPLTT